MQDTMTGQGWQGEKAQVSATLSEQIERLVSAKLSRRRQIALCAFVLVLTVLLGWGLHDEFQLTPVLLCLVASTFLALVTELPVALGSGLASSLVADYLFIGPPGFLVLNVHFVLRQVVFLSTAFLVNFLVGMIRRAYLLSTEARRAAEAANREKDEILAILAHDLRAPLTAAQLSLQLIERQLPPSDHRDSLLRHAGRAREACKRVNGLVVDLLDSAKAASGGLPLHRDTNDLAALAQSVANELRVVAAQANIRLDADVPPGGLPFYGDAHRISQLIANLVGNALKFTPPGGTVTLRVHPNGKAARIEVADTGVGMSESQLRHLFERFWQAERTSRSGVGLGLFIVKAIVDAHGGAIHVTSEPHKGSTFAVDLPG
jgi:signal transduction histidine kinase